MGRTVENTFIHDGPLKTYCSGQKSSTHAPQNSLSGSLCWNHLPVVDLINWGDVLPAFQPTDPEPKAPLFQVLMKSPPHIFWTLGYLNSLQELVQLCLRSSWVQQISSSIKIVNLVKGVGDGADHHYWALSSNQRQVITEWMIKYIRFDIKWINI